MATPRDNATLQGELQQRVMRVLWDLDSARVEEVRSALGGASAYTTVQTVLNRLAERGIVLRDRGGGAIVYRPAVSEADFLSNAFSRVFDNASAPARRLALSRLVDELEATDLGHAQEMAAKARQRQRRT